MMELLPAIDLIDGRAVRLLRGDFDERSDYGDPLRLAQEFLDGGANWLHVVDLDGAKSGSADNRPIVLAMAALGAAVETGGGIRTTTDVEELLDAGVHRVVLGTAALEDPAWAGAMGRRFGEQVAIGLDYRRGTDGRPVPATKGWLDASALSVEAWFDALGDAPFGAVVVTAIDRDGTLGGPDLEGLTELLDLSPWPVIASGGVGSAGDLSALAQMVGSTGRRLAGAVVGKALVDGRVSMEEAVAACALSA